jgi:hypothetical protein
MRNDLLVNVLIDSSPLEKAAGLVLREALDGVTVHPCDEGDDVVAARSLPESMQHLLKALTGHDPFARHAQPIPEQVTAPAPIKDRPVVTVVPVVDANDDITHCNITVGDKVIEASLNQCSTDLREMILDECDELELTVDEIMTVTRASRRQMVRESERVKLVLEKLPPGHVAKMADGLSLWIDSKGALVHADWVEFGVSQASEVYPGPIGEIGEIDTEELYGVAQIIRDWLASPKTVEVDIIWLRETEKH